MRETPKTPAEVLTEAMSQSAFFPFMGASTPPRTEYLLKALADAGYEIILRQFDGLAAGEKMES